MVEEKDKDSIDTIIDETIRICIEQNILADYLKERGDFVKEILRKQLQNQLEPEDQEEA